jgi:hypothetical protein
MKTEIYLLKVHPSITEVHVLNSISYVCGHKHIHPVGLYVSILLRFSPLDNKKITVLYFNYLKTEFNLN